MAACFYIHSRRRPGWYAWITRSSCTLPACARPPLEPNTFFSFSHSAFDCDNAWNEPCHGAPVGGSDASIPGVIIYFLKFRGKSREVYHPRRRGPAKCNIGKSITITFRKLDKDASFPIQTDLFHFRRNLSSRWELKIIVPRWSLETNESSELMHRPTADSQKANGSEKENVD